MLRCTIHVWEYFLSTEYFVQRRCISIDATVSMPIAVERLIVGRVDSVWSRVDEIRGRVVEVVK